MIGHTYARTHNRDVVFVCIIILNGRPDALPSCPLIFVYQCVYYSKADTHTDRQQLISKFTETLVANVTTTVLSYIGRNQKQNL
jgi:hypothetical protein